MARTSISRPEQQQQQSFSAATDPTDNRTVRVLGRWRSVGQAEQPLVVAVHDLHSEPIKRDERETGRS